MAKSLGNGSRAAADWVSEIKQVWARGTVHTRELAILLSRAKAELARGEWGALWKKPNHMPFGISKAKALVSIGEMLERLKGHTCDQLPAGWRILHQLARLGPVLVEDLVTEGIIHPALKLSEAEALVVRYNAEHAKQTRRANVRQWLRRSKMFIETAIKDGSWAEVQLALAELNRVCGGPMNPAKEQPCP